MRSSRKNWYPKIAKNRHYIGLFPNINVIEYSWEISCKLPHQIIPCGSLTLNSSLSRELNNYV